MSIDFAISRLHRERPIAAALHLQVVFGGFASADAAAMAVGLKPIGSSWKEIDRSDAEVVLATILSRDMAYGLPRLESSIISEAIQEFFEECPPDCRFFTNGHWGCEKGNGWMPATEATFDGGILALGSTAAGIFWLEDED